MRLPIQLIPALLALASAGWFVYRPGWGTFAMALIAFFLWLGVFVAEAMFRGVLKGKKKIEKIVAQISDDARGIDRSKLPDDEAYRGLWKELESAESEPGVREPSRRALQQLSRLPELFHGYQKLLRARLNPEELTLARYLESGQKLHDRLLSELREISLRLTGARALKGRLLDEQLGQVGELLGRNDQALEQMARACAEISKMRGVSGREPEALGDAIRDLAELADRARRY